MEGSNTTGTSEPNTLAKALADLREVSVPRVIRTSNERFANDLDAAAKNLESEHPYYAQLMHTAANAFRAAHETRAGLCDCRDTTVDKIDGIYVCRQCNRPIRCAENTQKAGEQSC